MAFSFKNIFRANIRPYLGVIKANFVLKTDYDTNGNGVVDESQGVVIFVRNNTGQALIKGQLVFINGSIGQNSTVSLAIATSEAASKNTVGVVSETILNNSVGKVKTSGSLELLNTSAFQDGDELWLSEQIAGSVQNARPTAPNHAVFIGWVAHAHPTQGKITLHIQNWYELGELQNVDTTDSDPLDFLQKQSNGIWKGKAVTFAGLADKPNMALYALLSELSAYIADNEIGITVPPLLNGKVPSQYLNLSGINPLGFFNPKTMTPNISDTIGGNNGDMYLVKFDTSDNILTVNINLGSGTITLKNGTLLIFFTASSRWEASDKADDLNSINGKLALGDLILSTDDIAETNGSANKWFTNQRAIDALSATLGNYVLSATLGSLASKNQVDYNTDIENKPNLAIFAQTANLKALAFKDKVDYTTDIENLPAPSVSISTTEEDPVSPVEGYAWFLKKKETDIGEIRYFIGGMPVISTEVTYAIYLSSKINGEIYRVKMQQNLV